MIFISKKRILASIFILIFAFSISFISSNKNNILQTSGDLKTYKIIVDAGHGLPDGGAVAANGIEEASLNLQIATKLQEELENSGYEVIMTRESDVSTSTGDSFIKRKDLENRLNLMKQNPESIFVSIFRNPNIFTRIISFHIFTTFVMVFFINFFF